MGIYVPPIFLSGVDRDSVRSFYFVTTATPAI
jgi:hypothetical protein